MDKKSFYTFIDSIRDVLGFSGISILNLTARNIANIRNELSKVYSANRCLEWPEYMRKTAEQRSDPGKLLPWAKSLVTFAFPFNSIPINQNSFPQTDDLDKSGLVAGYAGRIDYHVFLKQRIHLFSVELQKYVGKSFNSEIFVDTKPVSEKSIAAFTGLGAFGLNSCILCRGAGSGTCLGILALDISVPETEPVEFSAPCSTCGKCFEKCPTGAICGKPNTFGYIKCRSYLSMEKKGVLVKSDRALLGEWIFGCDICTSICPNSKIPPPLKMDLEWLLLEKDSTVNNIIKMSPMSYPGIKLLRRNAICVLGNKISSKGRAIIAKFADSTRDEMLKLMADAVLQES